MGKEPRFRDVNGTDYFYIKFASTSNFEDMVCTIRNLKDAVVDDMDNAQADIPWI
jgi:hypothetical protein